MADFDPAFGLLNATKRYPDETEANAGFLCGPADRDLFNGIIHQLCAELGEVITYGGVTHTNDRHTLVRKAIQNMLTPYLEEVNGDSDGGEITVTDQIVLTRSDAVEWTLNMPTSGISLYTTPKTILDINQSKSADYDTGNVTLDLNTLSGVTVPSGAKGVIVRCSTGVNGNQDRIAESSTATFGYAWIQAGGTPAATNYTFVDQVNNMVSYSDTNLGGGDNDNTNDAIVPITGTDLVYRGRVYWSGDNTGTDTGRLRMRLLGFVL